MRNLIPFVLASLFLTACQNDLSATQEHLLENPLYAERYAEEIVDTMVSYQLEAQELAALREEGEEDLPDPTLNEQQLAIADTIRRKWLSKAQDARRLQRQGTLGNFFTLNAYATGEVLFLDNVVYFGSDLSITPSPGLRVYLSDAVDPRTVEFPDETAVDLGPIKNPYGAQRYEVPETDTDVSLYRTIVIWNQDLDLLWTFAQIRTQTT